MARRNSRKKARTRQKQSSDISEDTQTSEIQDGPSTAQRLPFEVLSEIFLYSAPTSYHPYIKAATLSQWKAFFANIFPMNIATVCRSWREAALNTDSLWSTMFIEVHSASSKAIHIMECFLRLMLRRSKRCTLTCCIRFSGTYDRDLVADAVRLLLDYQERWKWVEIDLGAHDVRKALTMGPMQLDLLKLNALETLAIHGDHWLCCAEQTPVRYPRNAARITPCLGSIRIVHLLDMRASDLFVLLVSAPCLEELEIRRHKYDRGDALPGGPIPLSNLQRLKITYPRSFTVYPDIFLANLVSERLEELCLVYPVDNGIPPLPAFVAHNQPPTIRALHLDFRGSHLTEGDLDGLIQSMQLLPSLSSLILIWPSYGRSTDAGGMIGRLCATGNMAGDNDSVLCPALTCLHLENMLVRPNLAAQMINTRWRQTFRTIESITLTACCDSSKRHRPWITRATIEGACGGIKECCSQGLVLNIS